MNRTRAACAAAALLLLPVAAAAAPAATAATAATAAAVRYVVKPGDTLIDLARRTMVRPDDWRVVARINAVDDPYRMPVGKVLTIPANLLRREPLTATVSAFSGQVGIDPGGKARLGLEIAAGTTIATGPNSFVTLALADGSRVTLPSQSRVRVAVLDRVVIDGRLDRRFDLVSGNGDFGVTPRERPEDRFIVRTPVAVAAVRGTEFRVAHDMGTGNSVIGVVEGEVAGRPMAGKGETAVPAGQGAVVGGSTLRAATLLPAPKLLRPGKVQDEPAVVFSLAPDGAARHHLQLARDAGFVDLFAETQTTASDVAFDAVENATLYVRATSIDADGVEGMPAEFEVERFLNGLESSAAPVPGIDGPRRTQFRWQPAGTGTRSYDFVLARDAALANRVVDAPGIASTGMMVAGLTPGTWYWRVTVIARDGVRRFVKTFPVRTLTIAAPER